MIAAYLAGEKRYGYALIIAISSVVYNIARGYLDAKRLKQKTPIEKFTNDDEGL
jgi:hypothetical protein